MYVFDEWTFLIFVFLSKQFYNILIYRSIGCIEQIFSYLIADNFQRIVTKKAIVFYT